MTSPRATPEFSGESDNSEQSSADGAAVSAESTADQTDAAVGNAAKQTAPTTGYALDLAEVASRLTTLPDAVRLAVMALIQTASR